MMWDAAPGLLMLIWLVFGLLMLALLVAGLIWLVRAIVRGGGDPPPSWSSDPASAREELDRRYARGEITREEYRRIRGDLEAPGG